MDREVEWEWGKGNNVYLLKKVSRLSRQRQGSCRAKGNKGRRNFYFRPTDADPPPRPPPGSSELGTTSVIETYRQDPTEPSSFLFLYRSSIALPLCYSLLQFNPPPAFRTSFRIKRIFICTNTNSGARRKIAWLGVHLGN